MNIKKSLIALSVFSILMGGAWEVAVAKSADKEQDSVKRWGRWAVLSPAAGQEEAGLTTIAAANDLGSCESSENCPGIQPVGGPVEPPPPIEPPPPPPPPPPPEVKSPCEAGMPCGFARIDHPYTKEETAPESSEVVPFELTLDEEGDTVKFAVDPDSATAIVTDDMPALINQTGVLALGSSSILTGKITRNGLEPTVVVGAWRDTSIGSDENIITNGGEYVWGLTATADQMQNLVSSLGGEMTAIYQGNTMGVTTGNVGAVMLEVNFTKDTWSGEFNNKAFTASGVVVDSGFVSNANGFSNTVASGEVKGGFVNSGNNAIGGYEVEFKNGLKDADVFKTDLQVRN